MIWVSHSPGCELNVMQDQNVQVLNLAQHCPHVKGLKGLSHITVRSFLFFLVFKTLQNVKEEVSYFLLTWVINAAYAPSA